MNLFLKNNKSLTRNNHSLTNKYEIKESFKTGINHKNKISFINIFKINYLKNYILMFINSRNLFLKKNHQN